MSFFTNVFLGVKIWIWLYFLFSILSGIGVIIYFYKEKIKKKYYSIRYPEKLLKVVIHYKSGFFKEYWRLIPEDNFIMAEKKVYNFVDSKIIKTSDVFAKKSLSKSKEESTFKIDGKNYTYKEFEAIKKRWRSYPEIHYFFNVPNPIGFDVGKKKIDMTSKQLEEFKENDLFAKLLTMETEKRILMFILILLVLNTLATFFIVAHLMGWLEKVIT